MAPTFFGFEPRQVHCGLRPWFKKEYYVRKALTNTYNEPSLPKYAFIASANDDFNPMPNNPNEVQEEYGSIFCENSMISKLNMIPGGKALRCGIQKVLSFLCFVDRDVNPGMHINFDLEKLFRKSQDEDPLDTMRTFRTITRDLCKKLVRVKIPKAKNALFKNVKEKLQEEAEGYVEGAKQAGYDYVLIEAKIREQWKWDVYDIENVFDADRFDTRFGECRSIWYFCRSAWPFYAPK